MAAADIQFHNTLTQSLEPFVPITPGKVKLYLCGLTTYDHAHAGHARVNVVFDVLVRFLRARGLEVTFVRNITDVDDKILNRAKELGEEPTQFSGRMAEVNAGELAAVGCMKPDIEPRVSTHIGEIVDLTQRLLEKNIAYRVKTAVGEDVYFSVRSFENYGKLSRRNIDDLRSGARVEVGDVKRDPLDFALWKGCDAASWGFDSPFGRGRPGWHIECSAMSMKYLGEQFDIHAGGMDLIFPHHENEIAQSEAASGKAFARYWLHNGFLTVDQEKMSKSLGNFVTIKDVLERNDGEALRYLILGTHYRGPLGFDVDKKADGRVVFPGVDEAERRVEYLYSTRESLVPLAAEASGEPVGKRFEAIRRIAKEAPDRLLSTLDKDLNTPQALAVVAEIAKAGNDLAAQVAKAKKDPAAAAEGRGTAKLLLDAFDRCLAPLGLLQAPADAFFSRTQERRLAARKLDRSAVDAKVGARNEARAAKDFARSDAIRDELTQMGVEILDGPTGTTWKVVV
jgi:cysteinyl-tRNA synthetase